MPIYNGNKKIDSLYFNGKKIASAFFGSKQVYSASGGRLPSAFQQVEYIESTGTQWIDTQVVQKIKPKIELTFMKSSDFDKDICGNQNATNGCFIINVDGVRVYYRYSYSSSKSFNAYLRNEVWCDIVADNNFYLKVDNYVTENSVAETSWDFSMNTQSIMLFRGRTNAPIKAKTWKIYDNDVLLREMIPCYRKADNVAGLYDLVNGVFYTNAGTGDFIVGGDV